jgi:hypothetical protein
MRELGLLTSDCASDILIEETPGGKERGAVTVTIHPKVPSSSRVSAQPNMRRESFDARRGPPLARLMLAEAGATISPTAGRLEIFWTA